MSSPALDTGAISGRLWKQGHVLLSLCLGAGFLCTLLLAWAAPGSILLWPALLLGIIILPALISRPAVHLSLVLAGFAFILTYEEGIQIQEALFGLYLIGYSAGWWVYHAYFRRDPILHIQEDRALLLFLLFATATFGMTLLFRGNLAMGFSEWIPLIVLALYYPVKEACARNPAHALKLVLAAAGFLALSVVVRNGYIYYVDLHQAEYAWQIMMERVRTAERLPLVGTIGALTLYLFSKRRSHQLGFLLLSTFLLAGVIIGLSRALWVSLFLGLAVVFLLVDRKQKKHLLMISLTGLATLTLIGFLVLPDLFGLILTGLLERAVSLGGAATRDLSLVNRFVEWEAAWEAIKRNPVLGYGFGVDYSYYSLVYELTHERSHIHSTYLGILYRHGIIGFALLMFFYLRITLRGIQLVRLAELPDLARAAAILCVACLTAVALAGSTEDLLLIDDGALAIGIPAAVISGLWQHFRDGSHSAGEAAGTMA